MFLVIENEQLVKGLDNLREGSFNKTLISKTLPENFCQGTNFFCKNHNQWKIALFFIKILLSEIRTTRIHLGVKNCESNTELIDNTTEEKVYRNFKVLKF